MMEPAATDQAAARLRRGGQIMIDGEQGLEEGRIGEQGGVQRSSERGTMAKTGRNDPCPCGSGQKYKRCCLPPDEAAALAAEAKSSPTHAAIDADDDGLERLAMVYAARGDRPRAAQYYRKAADFVHVHADQYDPEMEIYFREKVTEFESPKG